jgi:hypothetical protein
MRRIQLIVSRAVAAARFSQARTLAQDIRQTDCETEDVIEFAAEPKGQTALGCLDEGTNDPVRTPPTTVLTGPISY